MVSIGERACLLALGCISRLPSLAMGMLRCSIGNLLYTYSIYSTQSFGLSLRFGLRPSVSIPYPYAAPTRAMQGVTSYKSLVLILIHIALLKWIQIKHLQAV